LVAPFLLIAFGVILLVNNLRPDLSLTEMIGAYWPLLLVLWGVLRLAELLASAARAKPLPAAGITGGEWALVVLICILASSVQFARSEWPNIRLGVHGLEIFGEAFDYPLAAEREVGEAPRILVENLRGNTRIVGGDTQTLKVEGRTTIRALDQDDANRASEKCPLEIVEQGGEIIVRSNQERAGGEWKVTTDLELTVPRGASIQGRGRYGDFDVVNIGGNVEIDSDNAGVRLTEIGGDARVDLRRSDIVRIVNLAGSAEIRGRGDDVELENIQGKVTINGSYSGELSMRNLAKPLSFESKRTQLYIEATPGQIRMELGDLVAENVAGPIRLKTRSRDVRFTEFTGELRLDIERGDVELRPDEPLGPVEVEVGSGDIELALPESSKFDLEAVTKRGEAVNEHDAAVTVEPKGEQGAKMTGATAEQPKIRLETGRGDVTLRRSTGGAAPKRLQTDSAFLYRPPAEHANLVTHR